MEPAGLCGRCTGVAVPLRVVPSPCSDSSATPSFPSQFEGKIGLPMKLQYFGHLLRRADSLEKTLMLGKIEGRRRRGGQRMKWLDGITDSMDVGLGGTYRNEDPAQPQKKTNKFSKKFFKNHRTLSMNV